MEVKLIILKKVFTLCLAFFMIASVITIIAPNDFNALANPGILYVGGGGGGNYSTIQSAVTAASNGDTIFVYAGTYNENIVINSQVSLIGENKFTTIIDPQSVGTGITIQSDWVNVTGFTITNCGSDGIYIWNKGHIRIEDNVIKNNVGQGVELNSNCNNVTIARNSIDNCSWGILLSGSNKDNLILNNKLSNNLLGIYFWSSNSNNTIVGNTISNNSGSFYSITISSSSNNRIYHNNFVNNPYPAYDDSTNKWDIGYPGGGNFWDRYNGTDIYQGPGQNIPGNDGIGDISIAIASGTNVDNYPLWPNWNALEVYTPLPGPDEVCEYAMGSIKVGIIFVESNGSIDFESENWTVGEINTVLTKIQEALNWWSTQNPNASLSFSKVNLGIKNTSYEPIIRTHNDEQLWVNEIMGDLGYTATDFRQRVKDYNHWLRSTYSTDWAFTIFVVDSSNDTDGNFSDPPWCAWAWWEYGSIVMTYDNDGWGINNMHRVAAHEIGHMFYATDEYQIPGERSGYLNALESGAMAGHLMFDNTLNLSIGSMQQIGWRDSDLDTVLDILDTIPNTFLDPASGGTTTDETPLIFGAAVVVPLNNDNPYGQKNAVTLNTISYVQYRIDNGTWMNATAKDGAFDGPVEYFNFKPGYLSGGQHFIEARAVNSVNNSDITFANISLTILTGADTIYVDDDFVDNPLLHQWDTITEGVSDANNGDIVYVYDGVYNESVVVNKTINLTGESNTGTIIDGEGDSLPLWINATNVNVTNLSVFNSTGYCLNVTGSNVSLSQCRIFDNLGYGINVRNSPDFTIRDCYIFNTTKTGLNIRDSERCTIMGTTIYTTGTSGYGMYIRNSNNSVISDCRINTTGTNSFGIYHDGKTLRIYNTIINSSTSADIYIINQGTMISVNCAFSDLDVEQDGGGVLVVKNYLTIIVYYEDGMTPILGADVEVRDNANLTYASAGYGGTDPQTDASGRVGPMLVQDRWYNLSNTPIENITDIKAKKTIDLTWEGTLSDVNMSTSHIEYLSATDIVAPPKPTGLTVIRVAGTNDLNISWNQNLDTHNYSVYYSVGSGPLIQIANVTHPQNWTMHLNLTDGKVYRYTIRAWDLVGLSSQYSDPVYFNLTDMTPPTIPKNLTAKPVVDGDELELSWDQNIDDTVNYELWWSEAVTGPWTKVDNVTHPTNFTTFSDPILVNGSTYYFKIRAWDEAKLSSGFSIPISVVHIDYLAPGAPTGLEAVAESTTNITLTWLASTDSDVQGYRVYINQSGAGTGGPYYLHGNVDTLTYQFTDLMENTTYYFVVRAFDEANRLSAISIEAKNTTLSKQPGIPIMDSLPRYTNNSLINITGTADKFVTILVFNNGLEAGSGSTDGDGKFKIQITLVEDLNEIKARARNNAMVEGKFSETQNITLDTEKPIAIAGDDLNIYVGQTVTFSAASSTDNYGIVNYTWSFIDFGDKQIKLYSEVAEYKFEYTGYFEVILTLTDVAGNFGTDSLWVDVKSLPMEQPVIKKTVPENNSDNVPVDVKVIITFSLPMDTDSVANVLKIIPDTDHNIFWNMNTTELTIEFTKNLEYDKEYSISIGKAQGINGLDLKGATFVLVFNTENAPGIPKITITTQPGETEVEPGETITISGTTTGISEGTQVIVKLGSETAYDSIAADGSWSVSIKAPEAEGTYDLTVEIGNVTETGSVIIKKPTAPENADEDGDNGFLGLGPMMDYLIILIIIVIIIILVMLALRKKPKEEPAEEAEVPEDEELEDEEVEEGEPGKEDLEEELEDEELEDEELEEGEPEEEDLEELEEEELEDEELEDEELEEVEPEEEELEKREPEEKELEKENDDDDYEYEE